MPSAALGNKEIGQTFYKIHKRFDNNEDRQE
jgi:hypothetical protein